jgi:hypothetical protein
MDALPALGREERHDVVSGRNGDDALADRLDDARSLVSQHARRVPARIRAGGRVQVGVADAAGDEAHEDLAGLGLREVDLLHGERPPELLEHGGADPHILNLALIERVTRVCLTLAAVALVTGCGGDSGEASKAEYLARGDAVCADAQVEAADLARRAQGIQAESGTLSRDELLERASEVWGDQIEFTEEFRGRLADLDAPSEDQPRVDEFLASIDDGLDTAREIKATLDDGQEVPRELVQTYAGIVERGNTLARAYGFQVCGRSP